MIQICKFVTNLTIVKYIRLHFVCLITQFLINKTKNKCIYLIFVALQSSAGYGLLVHEVS
jgi:hypothetical protein